MTRQTRFLRLAGASLAAALLAAACAPSSGRPDGRSDGRGGGGADTSATAGGPDAPVSRAPAGGPDLDTLVERPDVAQHPDTPPAASGVGDAAVQRLEREARALAKVEGCDQADQCRTAPLGSRPCGGPRAYLVYCPLRTDSAALFRKLEELARAEEAYNRKGGMISTCELRMPPTVDAVGGRCVTGTGR